MLGLRGPRELNPSSWHFDAFHPLAGMAFVSRTSPGGGDDEVMYFRPPYFRPEPIGRPSLALGAARGGFQSGLVIEGREVSFPSLAAAGEFVRRAYGRGAAGDDGGPPEGGEPQGGPGPDRRRPDNPERWQSEPNDALMTVVEDMNRFRQSIAGCEFGEARPMTWFRGLALDTIHGASDILFNGAAHALCDALDESTPELSDEMRRSIRRLGGAFWSIGIDPDKVFDFIYRSSQSYFKLFSSEQVHVELVHRWRYTRLDYYRSDPLELPSKLAGPLDAVLAQRPNDLLSWLSRFLATPDDILATMPTAQCFQRAVFAAALIIGRRDWPFWLTDDEQLSMRNGPGNTALAWLREQLPKTAYCREYESSLAAMERPRGPDRPAGLFV